MKNLTIAILLLFSIAANAQVTPAPIKPPQISGYIFTPTGTISVPVSVTLSVNSGDLDAYIKVNAYPGGPQGLEAAKNISAYDVSLTIQAYNRVVASFQPINDTLAKVLNRKYNEYIKIDQARQKQDSTAKAKGVKP